MDHAANTGTEAKPHFQEYKRQQKGALQRELKNGWCSSKWPLEFFVLSSEFLVSFASQTSRIALQCISLAAVVEVAPRAKQRDRFLFVVRYATHLGSAPGDETRELLLRANDEAEVHLWISAINEASERRRHSQFFMPLREAQDCVADLERQKEHLLQSLDAANKVTEELKLKVKALEDEAARTSEEQAKREQESAEEKEKLRSEIQTQLEEIAELRRQLSEAQSLQAHSSDTAAVLARTEQMSQEFHELRRQLDETRNLEMHRTQQLEHVQNSNNTTTIDEGTKKEVEDLRREVEELRHQLSDALSGKNDKLEDSSGKPLIDVRLPFDTVAKAGARWLVSVFTRHQQKMLCSSWSTLGAVAANTVQKSSACLKAAGAACLLTQLSCIKSKFKTAAISSLRVQAARSLAKKVSIAAGAVRGEWVCRHSAQRLLATGFASLRPAPLPEAPLQYLSSLHRSMESHRLSTSFYLWRLRAAIPNPSLDGKFSVETQTEGRSLLEYFVNIGIQTSPHLQKDGSQTSPESARNLLTQATVEALSSMNGVVCSPPPEGLKGLSPYFRSGTSSPATAHPHKDDIPQHVSTNEVFDESVVEALNFSQLDNTAALSPVPVELLHVSRSSSRPPSPIESRSPSASQDDEEVDEEDPVGLELQEERCGDASQSSEDESWAFEQRWWHALADVAAGSGTEDDSNSSRPPRTMHGCTGSSYDDIGNGSNYDSSGGSANPDVVGSRGPMVVTEKLTGEKREPSAEKSSLPTPARPLSYPPSLVMTKLGQNTSLAHTKQLPTSVASTGGSSLQPVPSLASLSKPTNGTVPVVSRSPMRTLPPPPIRRGSC